MIRTRLLQTLTEQSRRREEWRDWDIVCELEQRDGDPAPDIRRYYCGLVVDWGDGNPVNYVYHTGAASYGPALSVGTHVVKIRVTSPNFGYAVRVVFGYENSSETEPPRCPQLKRVLKFDARNLRTINYSFNRCFRLEAVCPITGAEAVTAAMGPFAWTTHLNGSIRINSLKSCTAVTNFAMWSSVEEIVIGGGGMPSCIAFGSFARNCQRLKRAVVGKCPAAATMTYLFGACQSLEEFDFTGFGQDVTTISYAWHYCEKLSGSLKLPDMPNLLNASYACRNAGFKKIDIGKTPNCTTYNNAFFGCENLTELSLKDTSAVTDAAFMCANCQSLSRVSLGEMGAELTTISNIFYNTGNLRQDIVMPDMPNVTTAAYAFSYSGITSFKCGDLDLCTTMTQAFAYCQFLTSVEIGKCPVLDTTYQCFINDGALQIVKIDAGGHTLNYCTATFQYCQSLKRVEGKLKLRRDGPSNASYYNTLFQGCYALEAMPDIWPDDGWTTLRVANTSLNNLFQNCLQMTGTVPDLWTRGQPMYFPGTGNKTGCFTYCLKLSNYADIPVLWGTNVNVGE